MTEDCRPDPEALLERLQQEKGGSKSRGTLKIIVGAAAGVGKTFQMLEEAQSLKKDGVDVVIALVETHGRPETEALLQGLELIPRLQISHGGILLEEMDLNAVIERRPTVAIVDELAHTNAPGVRNAKRYQDVEELLGVGISVFTTMNIQHVESLNDIVYQITGVQVRETVPDGILEMADELELVDLPPEELLTRLADGKVYVPRQAEQAISRFFRKGNLLGLREMALRFTARRVDEDIRSYMRVQGILGPWPAGTRLLVCINQSPLSERLIRIGQRMAADLDADWFTVYVESPKDEPASETERDKLERNLTLARVLGAKVQVLFAQNIPEEILSFARKHNVTLVIVGLPRRSHWNRWLRGSVVNRIINQSGQIHVLVIGGSEVEHDGKRELLPSVMGSWGQFSGSLISVAVVTGFCWMLKSWLELINIAMILLLPVVYSGTIWGRRSGLVASSLAVLALDLFFVPPLLTLAVEDIRYLPMFAVFYIVGIVTSFLADQVRQQGESARSRERFVSALYSFSSDLLAADNLESLLRYAAKEIAEAFECEVMILLPDEFGQFHVRAQMGEHLIFDERKLGAVMWVFQHGKPAGHGTETLSSATLLYLPLTTDELTIGVLGVGLGKSDRFLRPEQRRLLEAFSNILALAIARAMNSNVG